MGSANDDGAVPGGTRLAPIWQDVALGSAFVVLGLYAAYRVNYVDTPGFIMSTGPLDYATVPTIASVGITLLALIYTAGALRKLLAARRTAPTPADEARPFPWGVAARRLGTLVLLVAYVMALKTVPFLAATAIFLAAMFVLFGQKSPLRVAAVALVGAGGLYLLFVVALHLPL